MIKKVDKMRRGALRRAFAVAALCAGVIAAGCEPKPLYEPKEGPPVTLEKGEKELARSIFGDEIDLRRVWKVYVQVADSVKAAESSRAGFIFFYRDYHAPDYSRERDPFIFATFIHELTHQWQIQNDPGNEIQICQIYTYRLSSDRDFLSYCNEQQASIVQDYVRRFLLLNPAASTRYVNVFVGPEESADTPESDALLQKVVEDQFPQARETRLKIDAQRRASQQISIAYHP